MTRKFALTLFEKSLALTSIRSFEAMLRYCFVNFDCGSEKNKSKAVDYLPENLLARRNNLEFRILRQLNSVCSPGSLLCALHMSNASSNLLLLKKSGANARRKNADLMCCPVSFV